MKTLPMQLLRSLCPVLCPVLCIVLTVVYPVLASDLDGVAADVDLDNDNDGIPDHAEGAFSVPVLAPASSYQVVTSTSAAQTSISGAPSAGFTVSDTSTRSDLSFTAVAPGENGLGGGRGTLLLLDVEFDIDASEQLSDPAFSVSIDNGFDDGLFVTVNGAVVIEFDYADMSSSFHNEFDLDGAGWQPWLNEGSPEIRLDPINRIVELTVLATDGVRKDILPFIPGSKPEPFPDAGVDSGIEIGIAYNNSQAGSANTPGAIGPVTIEFTSGSDGVLTHRDTDGDGVFDYQDLDSDNDGISDLRESGTGLPDAGRDGVIDSISGVFSPITEDINANGVHDLAESDNLIVNGDFNASFESWFLIEAGPDAIEDVGGAVRFNGQAAQGTSSYLYQDASTVAGRTYLLSFQTQVEGATAGVDRLDFTALDGDARLATRKVLLRQGDAPAVNTVAFTATSNTTRIRFSEVILEDNSLNIFVDNVYLNESLAVPLADNDKDNVADTLDLDSDNDGIPDTVELRVSRPFVASDADVSGNDADGDGVVALFDNNDASTQAFGASFPLPVDTDDVAPADYLASDSDGDSISDDIESGLVLSFSDTDGNGADDALHITYKNPRGIIADPVAVLRNSDGDTSPAIPDYRDTDADNDGIGDSQEGIVDTDGDGIPNYIDTDSDNDSLADLFEGDQDVDSDGLAAYIDADTDGDGLADSLESASDTDNDGIADYLDVDSDNDGIPDSVETGGSAAQPRDTDGDGAPDYLDADSDADGISDSVEAGSNPLVPQDTDADGLPDYIDEDSNADGIPDAQQTGDDRDGDGIPNDLDADSNNDGLIDADIIDGDADQDGVPNAFDGDMDGDGLVNLADGISDEDGDGVPNYLDTDSDADGLSDELERAGDADGDSIPNFLDADSDGDGIADIDESGRSGINDTPRDTDADGIADYLDADADNDSIPDRSEGIVDTDLDGVADYIDTDSDGDGIPDAIERESDTDKDGAADYVDLDADADGINDSVEAGSNPMFPDDTDADGIFNFRDLDSDADGILDRHESSNDSDGDGIPDASDTDSNNDGIPDALVGLSDSDGDGIEDYLDDDIDGDGIANISEADAGNLLADTDGDGIANYQDTDSDNDTIPDTVEGVGSLDGDGIPNFLDTDSDDDGIDDIIELLRDTDGDGTPDYLSTDSDGDRINDSIEGVIDTDNDRIPDYLDRDTDGDGVPDSLEGTGDNDEDMVPNFRDTDSNNDNIDDGGELRVNREDFDGDGILNIFDPDLTGGPDVDGDGVDDEYIPRDTDRDGVPDFADPDADNDGIANIVETVDDVDDDDIPNFIDVDSDGDGVPDLVEGYADVDGDGAGNSVDVDADNDGISDTNEGGSLVMISGQDEDRDLIDNALDVDFTGGVDANDNGIDDAFEPVDTDKDGNPDYIDRDADGDNVPDVFEAGRDTDGNAVPDYLQIDANGDSIADGVAFGLNKADADNDGIVDLFDPDATGGRDRDNDGVDDNFQVADSDADTVPDYIDLDADNDGIAGITEGVIDSDADGIPNDLDLDSDNDGIADLSEAGILDAGPGGRLANFIDRNADGFDDAHALAPEPLRDSDSDGVPDLLDLDSDNDGLTDVLEYLGTERDADFDGRIDTVIDFNGDGFDDSAAIPGSISSDLDSDGFPDYIDLDSDGDKLYDIVEAGAIDNDNDGILDSMRDADLDGIPDTIDASFVAGPDADNDGIIDSANVGVSGGIDTDADGIIDSLDPDADGDGRADVQADTTLVLGAALPDIDGDGQPDVYQVASDASGQLVIGTRGIGCSVASGDSAQDHGMIVMLVLSVLLFISAQIRHRREQLAACRPVSRCMLLLVVIAAPGAFARDTVFEPSYYGTVGLGASHLDPDTSGVANLDVNDRVQQAGQFTLGTHLHRNLSLELHASELGSAGLSPQGQVGYQSFGASALLYAGRKHNRIARRGLNAFARIGLGTMRSNVNRVPDWRVDNRLHLLVGAGFEYMGARSFGARAELISFDEDAAYAQLALVYRFGSLPDRGVEIGAAMPEADVANAEVPFDEGEAPALGAAFSPADTDADGDLVVDSLDVCLQTPTGAAVDARGCALFAGIIEGVTFKTASADLSETAKRALDSVARTLEEYPTVALEISAHTDSNGDEAYNHGLSRLRSRSVVQYLRAAGVASWRLTARSYGESFPLDYSGTETGRARNRRIEFFARRRDVN